MAGGEKCACLGPCCAVARHSRHPGAYLSLAYVARLAWICVGSAGICQWHTRKRGIDHTATSCHLVTCPASRRVSPGRCTFVDDLPGRPDGVDTHWEWTESSG